MARAILRRWRDEWGESLSVEDLMRHGLCRHAEWEFSMELSPAKKKPKADRPAAGPLGLPTDKLCALPKCRALSDLS